MTSTASLVTLSTQDYHAVLFDLDGVLTKTRERAFSGMETAVRWISLRASVTLKKLFQKFVGG